MEGGHRIDRIETFEGARIQHGTLNRRIYVMHLDTGAVGRLIPALADLAAAEGYGKITAKIPTTCWPPFRSAGYVGEARIPGFYQGLTDALFVARFVSRTRMQADAPYGIPEGCNATTTSTLPAAADKDATTVTACRPADAGALGRLYAEVFESYPFPIYDPAFLRQTMQKETFYYCIRIEGRIAAAAAAETDPASRSCEMTDFATRPEYRRRHLAGRLLQRMHRRARQNGLSTAFYDRQGRQPRHEPCFRQTRLPLCRSADQ